MNFIEGLVIVVLGIIFGIVFGVFIAKFFAKRNKKKLEKRAIEKIKEQKNKTFYFRDKDIEVQPKAFYNDGKKVDLEENIKRDLAGLPPKAEDKKIKKVVKPRGKEIKKSGSFKKKSVKRRSKK